MMAHFAKIENDIVTQVIVVADELCAGGDFPNSEPAGQAFIASLGLNGEWKQTSYNTYLDYAVEVDDSEPPQIVNIEFLGSKHRNGGKPFRGKYAAIGDRYDAELDEFVTPVTEVAE
jgi:hypothetical protein